MGDRAAATRPRRKAPEKRKGEISEAAGRIATEDGLAHVTAKRVADAVGVYPGLVTHYFRTADDLAATALATASERRRERQAAKIAKLGDDPTAALKLFLHDNTAPESDPDSLLWLDALRECSRRPALQREVIGQMELDLASLTDLIDRGVSAGQFLVDDANATAMLIWAIIDGHAAQSAVRTAIAGTSLNYPSVTKMLLRTTETELGLAPGVLD